MQGRALLFMVLLGFSSGSLAEVYRWVDKAGKVHFSDKPPAANAENITKQVNKQNLDTSREELNKLEQLHRDTAQQQRQQTQLEPTAAQAYALATHCAAAKTRLKNISRNVIFLDGDGKVVNVNEKERQEMVAELTAHIHNNCH